MFVDKILACLIRLVSGCYFYINDNIMDDDDGKEEDVKIPWVCPNAMLLSLNAIGGQSHGTDTASSFVFFHCVCTVRAKSKIDY